MRMDSRLSRVLHVLLHMARHEDPFTSEQIAQMLQTNPVVVRRTLGSLRKNGYLNSEKGHGGGWTLACDLNQTTLLDIYQAMDSPRIFAMGHDQPHPDCAVEQVINQALETSLREAEQVLLDRFAAVTLAQLATEFDHICRSRGWELPADSELA